MKRLAALLLILGLIGSACVLSSCTKKEKTIAGALIGAGAGAGIGAAAWGIGQMAEGLGSLVGQSKGVGSELFTIAAGIGAINAAMMAGGVTTLFGGGLGLATFGATVSMLSKNAPQLAMVGEAFGNIAAVMSGTKEDFAQIERTVNAITQMDVGNTSTMAELVSLLKSPLKVEFSDKDVAITSNVTLNLDGRKLFDEMNITKRVPVQQMNYKQGKSG